MVVTFFQSLEVEPLVGIKMVYVVQNLKPSFANLVFLKQFLNEIPKGECGLQYVLISYGFQWCVLSEAVTGGDEIVHRCVGGTRT